MTRLRNRSFVSRDHRTRHICSRRIMAVSTGASGSSGSRRGLPVREARHRLLPFSTPDATMTGALRANDQRLEGFIAIFGADRLSKSSSKNAARSFAAFERRRATFHQAWRKKPLGSAPRVLSGGVIGQATSRCHAPGLSSGARASMHRAASSHRRALAVSS